MFNYLIRRVATSVANLFGISMVLFAVLALAPGDLFSELVTNPAIPIDRVESLRKQFGLDSPIHIRDLRWSCAMLQRDAP